MGCALGLLAHCTHVGADLFIERIQFAETRDYVKRILRNLATYRALYPVTQ